MCIKNYYKKRAEREKYEEKIMKYFIRKDDNPKTKRKKKKQKNDLPYYLLLLALLILAILLGLFARKDSIFLYKRKDLNQLTFEQMEALREEERASLEIGEADLKKNFSPIEQSAGTENTSLVVYVSGAVKEPGVYELAAGSLVNDLILKAGGFSETPHAETLNLAAKLLANSHIHVPFVEDMKNGLAGYSQGQMPDSPLKGGPVSLNYGTAEELMTIPGIGPATARAIIAYREKQERLISREELLNISGIKEKKLEQISPYLCEP